MASLRHEGRDSLSGVEKPAIESSEEYTHNEQSNIANLNVRAMAPEERSRIEKSLLRKLDARCSYFVIIYIL